MAEVHRVRGAVERFASRVGRTEEQLLLASEEAIKNPRYPTAECLLPDQLVDFEATAVLAPEIQAHADKCPFCGDLLAAVVPDLGRVKAFRQQVEQERTKSVAEFNSSALGDRWTLVRWRLVSALASLLVVVAISGYLVQRPNPSGVPSIVSKQPLVPVFKEAVISSAPVSPSAGTPVRVVVRAIRPTTLVVRDSYLPVAASVAALSKAELDFSGAPIGEAKKEEVTEKAVFLLAALLEKSSQGLHEPVGNSWLKDAVDIYSSAQQQWSATLNEKSGVVTIRFGSNDDDSVDLNLRRALRDAKAYHVKLEKYEALRNILLTKDTTMNLGDMTVSVNLVPNTRHQ
jgi:hypothetical protein